jgi:hypothetical protein
MRLERIELSSNEPQLHTVHKSVTIQPALIEYREYIVCIIQSRDK